ncbi:MAG: hypothetical protein WBG41_15490 [Acidimicrobiales bacterium]
MLTAAWRLGIVSWTKRRWNSERVELLGLLDRDAITSLIGISSVVLVPSNAPDYFPTMVPEPMAAGHSSGWACSQRPQWWDSSRTSTRG